MSSKWVFDVQTTVYSRVKSIVTSRLISKYPDITFTEDDEVPTNPKFPNIYIHFLQPVERAETLDGENVNAIYLTAQADVKVTKAQGMIVAREVSAEVMDAFKTMRFTATMPEFQGSTGDTKRTVARYSRTIGSGDTI